MCLMGVEHVNVWKLRIALSVRYRQCCKERGISVDRKQSNADLRARKMCHRRDMQMGSKYICRRANARDGNE